MKTSSSVGRETRIELIGCPSPAKSLGTNCSPSATWKVTASSLTVASSENCSLQRRDRRLPVGHLQLDPVLADQRLERVGRVHHDQRPVVHDRDPAAVLGLVHVVRGQEDGDRLAVPELVDVLPDVRPRLRIEAHGRLVEEEDARRVDQPARYLQASLHAAREGSDEMVSAVGEADHGEHQLEPLGTDLGLDAVELGVKLEVLGSRQVVVERRLLKDEADVAAYPERLPHDVEAGDLGATGGRLQQRAEHVDRRRLAGAVRPEKAEDLALAHLERDPADCDHVAEAAHQIRRRNHGRQRARSVSPCGAVSRRRERRHSVSS